MERPVPARTASASGTIWSFHALALKKGKRWNRPGFEKNGSAGNSGQHRMIREKGIVRQGAGIGQNEVKAFALLLLYGCMMAAMVFYPRSAPTVALAMSLTAVTTGLLLFGDGRISGRHVLKQLGEFAYFSKTVKILMVSFLCLALLSLTWSPDPIRGLKDVGAFTLFIPIALYLAIAFRAIEPNLSWRVFVLGLGVALLLYAVEVFLWSGAFEIAGGVYSGDDANKTASAISTSVGIGTGYKTAK